MLKKLKPKSEFSRNVLTLMTGTTIAQAIPIAISPILTRIYTPEDFGMFALFMAIISIFSVIATGRYEQAILVVNRNIDAINIFILGFVINIIIVLLSLVIIFLFSEVLESYLKVGNYIYFIPLSIFLIGLFNLMKFFNNRMKLYKSISSSIIVKSIIYGGLQLLTGFLKMGVSGLIISQVISQFFGNMKLLRNINRNKTFLSQVSSLRILILLKKYKNFPIYQMPHSLLNSIYLYAPIFIFSISFSSVVVGYYSLANKMIVVPIMLIANASATVYNQKLSYIYNNHLNTYRFTIDFIKSLSKKIIIPFLVIIILAPELFSYIFGENWREAGRYTQILAPYILLNAIVSSIIFIASLVEMQKKALIVSIIHMVLTILAIYIGVFFNDIYLSLILYVATAIVILIYNLSWMLKELKRVDNENIT
jgi:O-antigen/teichoic acid export membrane protein